MREIAFVVGLTPNVRSQVKRAVSILNRGQNHFDFRAEPESPNFPSPDLGGAYSWDLLKQALTAEKRRLGTPYLFGVTEFPLEGNWFSCTVPEEHVCFITTANWESLSWMPVSAFVAYAVVRGLVAMLLGRLVFHEDTRGCLQDLCAHKPDYNFKIRTADICPDCLDLLRAHLDPGMPDVVVAMLEEVRRAALGRGKPEDANQSGTRLADVLDREFPFPLAYCFRSMQTELSYSRKWLKLLELYEVTLKYTAFVLLSALRQTGARLPADVVRHLSGLSRPSAGHWHKAWHALLKCASRSPTPCFVSRFLRGLDSQAIRKAHSYSERFVPLRNDTKGHGFVEEESRYRVLYEENVGDILALLGFIAPLARYPLVKVTGEVQHRRGTSRFRAKILTGSHPLFPVEERQSRDEIDTDCLLYDPEIDRYLSLYPWLILENCPECYREMVFLYDRLEGSGAILREYPTNHTQNRCDSAGEVRSILNLPAEPG